MSRPVTALLGPTNTGKTYLAMERMLEHGTGMIGFPLRLLARENYDRLVRARGDEAVALVTGEERIRPRRRRYYVCTVEAMPVDIAGGLPGRGRGPARRPTASGGTSSPIACCTRAVAARPCSSAPTPSARSCAGWCPAWRWCRGRDCRP